MARTMSETNRTILVVDDDEKVRTLLRRCLVAEGYAVLEAADARETFDTIAKNKIDLITLDLQLGADDGLTIATKLRRTSNVPIVMITGKGDLIDKVVGLELGADDYISKPFHVREVQARVKSALRRSSSPPTLQENTTEANQRPSDIYEFQGYRADAGTHTLTEPSGDICDLTTTDFRLLMLFLNAPKRVLSRDHIMDQLHGQEWTPYDRTVDNQIARLRKKIEADVANPLIIKTVRGIGYMFATDVIKH